MEELDASFKLLKTGKSRKQENHINGTFKNVKGRDLKQFMLMMFDKMTYETISP